MLTPKLNTQTFGLFIYLFIFHIFGHISHVIVFEHMFRLLNCRRPTTNKQTNKTDDEIVKNWSYLFLFASNVIFKEKKENVKIKHDFDKNI